MRASQAMTRDVIWIQPSDPIDAAFDLMSKLSIRHLPVLDGVTLVGMLSDRDILLRAHELGDGRLDVPPTPAEQVMSQPVLTCPPTATIAEVAALMLRQKIDSVPIVLEDGELVGLVTSSDLLQLLLERGEEEPLPFEFRLRPPPAP